MSDLISRQAAIDAIERLILPQVKGETAAEEINRVAWRCAINCAEEVIGHMPSAEVEPVKRGKWIYDNQFDLYRASCSECGYKRVTDIKAEKWNGWKYCPNCGAKMEPISASTENGQKVEGEDDD